MNEVVYIGQFDYYFNNKELKIFYIVSQLQALKNFSSDADKVLIFCAGKYFLNKEKAYLFAADITAHIHYIQYIGQSYPLMTYDQALTKIKPSPYYK